MTIDIKTPRYDLTRVSDEDYAFFCKLYSDPAVMKYITIGTCTPEKSRELLNQLVQHWKDHGYGMWVGNTKETSEKIGYMGFRKLPKLEGVEFAGFLARKFWGTGIPAEVGKAVMTYGFQVLDFDLIYSVVDPQNTPSLNCVKNFGMQHDPKKDGNYHGGFTQYFCITRDEFNSLSSSKFKPTIERL
jgi:RimJ/RimL family protein N-acetyltransferase